MYYFHSVYASRSLAAACVDAGAILASFALAWVFASPPTSALAFAGFSLLSMVMGVTVLFFNDG